jgi:RNA polymerase sigma-70 factor (ECF subfamily)
LEHHPLDAGESLRGRDSSPERGDVRAVAGGILAHLDAAQNLTSWLIGKEHDAQDVVQESYLRAMRSIGTFRGGDHRSWILAIVRNACFDWLRRNKVSPIDDVGDDLPVAATGEEADPAAILGRAEDIERIRDAIGQLPPGIREAVVLREMEGLSYKEIAAVTGVPIGTVMSRLARARRRLAQLLSGDCEPARGKAEE